MYPVLGAKIERGCLRFVRGKHFGCIGRSDGAPQIGYIANYTAGPSGVFMGDDNIAVASSSLPYYDIGPFSTDSSVGPALVGPPSASNGSC